MSNDKITVGRLFNIEKGSLQSSKNVSGDYDFITAAGTWKTHKTFTHNCEALVFAAAASGSLGRTHYVNGNFIASDLCFILTPKNLRTYYIDLKFYHFVFNNLREQIVKATKSGTSKDSINITNFSNYELPYTEKTQQEKWIKKLKKSEIIQTQLLKITGQQQNYLHQFRQFILQEAVQGKLNLQNATDEPASKLLERIKAEKQKLIVAGKLKKEKDLPPITEDEIPFELPKGWTWCRLESIAFVGTGATPLTNNKDYYNGNIAWITSSATGSLFVSEAEKYISEKALKETNCRIYTEGTLIVAMYGQGKTRGQITELLIKAATNQACAAIELVIKDESHKKYIKYFFQKIYLEIRELAEGGAQPNLNLQKIKDTLIPLPPLSEQHRIVDKVQQLMQMINQLKQQVQQSQTHAQQLLRAVLKEAFNSKAKVYAENELVTMAAEE